MKKIVFLISFLICFTAWCIAPYGIKGQNQSTIYSNVHQFPNSQVTNLGGINALVENDNENLLVNAGFEHFVVTTAWTTGTSNVMTATTSSVNIYTGKQAGALTTNATVAFSLSQDVTPNSGLASTQGEVTWAILVPVGVTDAQVCAVVNSVEQNCVTAVNSGVYREYSVPFIFGTAGQTAGIKLKTTATYTSGAQTIYVDKARVRPGLPIQNIGLDDTYSARISSTAVISNQNTSWLSSAVYTTTGVLDITVNTPSPFTITPNCTAIADINSNSVNVVRYDMQSSTPGLLKFRSSTAGAISNNAIVIMCQKNGSDYSTSSTSLVYSNSNSNYDWQTFTPTLSAGFGAPTLTNVCKQARMGGDMLIKCSFTNGTSAASLATLTVPGGLSIDAARITAANTTASPGQVVGQFCQNAAASCGSIVTATGTSTTLLYFTNGFGGLVPVNGNTAFASSVLTDFNIRIPISGWTNSAIIVGSFAGIANTPGYFGRVDSFKVSYGATATTICSSGTCAYLNQAGNGAVSVVRGIAGNYTLNTTKTYLSLKCTGSAMGTTSWLGVTPVNCSNCNAGTFSTGTGATATDSFGTLDCLGTF